MASHFLPHLNDQAKNLWNKLAVYIPKNLTGAGNDLAKSTIPVAPVKAKYKKRMDFIALRFLFQW